MKAFWTYNLMRLGLFLACYALIAGIWILTTDSLPIYPPLLIALVVSGVLSFWLLNRQREIFARGVEERAHRAATAYEARKAREDVD